MNCLVAIFVLSIVAIFIFTCLKRESFQLDHYLRPNYETGAAMLRGDLPIQPVKQSWFNTRYGPSSLSPGFFQTF